MELSRSARTARVASLAVLLAVAGVFATTLPSPASLAGLPRMSWWVLAGLFGVAEALVVRIPLRREHLAVSVSEVPLVMGLFLASPGDLLLARLLGSAVVFLAVRRQTLLKSAFNSGLVLAGTGAAIAVFELLVGGAGVNDARAWQAAMVSAATAGVLDAACITVVVRWYGDQVTAGQLLHEIATSILVPALVAVIGMTAVLAFGQGAAVLPLAVTGAAALLGYRAYAGLSERYARLARLHHLSDVLAAATTSAQLMPLVVTECADLLRAGYVEVVLSGLIGGQRTAWSLREGGQVTGPFPMRGPAGLDAGRAEQAGAHRIDPAATAGGMLLADRRVEQALVVGVRVDGTTRGHILVADRVGEEHGFTDADLRLLETFANSCVVAMRSARLVDRLHHEARHDELTGLPNRLTFRELLAEVVTPDRDAATPAVMLMDVDGFKSINDTLGHHAGDELLRELARRLTEAAHDQAVVARLGGDEFAVLTGPMLPEDAMTLARRLIGVYDEPMTLAGSRVRLGGSLGVAIAGADGRSGSELMRHADLAMYAAKAASGGVRRFSPDLVEASVSTSSLTGDLRDSVARRDITIAVQPVVDLATGQVHSVEALARWWHPLHGDVPPETFFIAAERAGQVVPLSALVLDRALEACRSWLDAGEVVRVAVNLAARWLADATLPEQVAAALARYDVPPDLLCLEITEGAVISNPQRSVDTLTRLRDLGVHLSVDDFGTGYSSMTNLSRLPVNQMKIDRSFLVRLGDSASDRAFVRSILDLGRNLGLDVVAEGVTDAATVRTLRAMGCTLVQGFLFGQPMAPDAVPGYLERCRSARPGATAAGDPCVLVGGGSASPPGQGQGRV